MYYECIHLISKMGVGRNKILLGPDVACQFEEIPMSHVSVAYLYGHVACLI